MVKSVEFLFKTNIGLPQFLFFCFCFKLDPTSFEVKDYFDTQISKSGQDITERRRKMVTSVKFKKKKLVFLFFILNPGRGRRLKERV